MGALGTNVLEDFRIDTGGKIDLGFCSAKDMDIPSTPGIPFIGLEI